MSGRSDILTHQDFVAARAGSYVELQGGRIVKQVGGSWRRVDATGRPAGKALSSSHVASYNFARHELRSPDGGLR